MSELLQQLVPLVVYFVIGVVLRVTTSADRSHGELLIRLILGVTLPMLVVTVLANATLTVNKVALPLASIVVNFACMLLALLSIRVLSLGRNTAGTLLVNTMIINTLFMLPFISAVYGDSGLVDAVLFELGNLLLMAVYVITLAFKYGEGRRRQSEWSRLAQMPLLWAYVLGLLLSISGVGLPDPVAAITDPLGRATLPFLMITMGLFVSLEFERLQLALLGLALRMGLGLLFGIAIANYLGVSDTTYFVVCLCAAAPVGIHALIYCQRANLDTRLGSTMVSLSLLVGIIYIPVLLLIFA